jgi:hypothetical protein
MVPLSGTQRLTDKAVQQQPCSQNNTQSAQTHSFTNGLICIANKLCRSFVFSSELGCSWRRVVRLSVRGPVSRAEQQQRAVESRTGKTCQTHCSID